MGNTTTFAGVIGQSGGARGLRKNGAGTLILSGANTYSGTTTLSAGTLLAGNDSAFGTGTLILAGGVLGAHGSARSLANTSSITASLGIGGDQDLTFSGAVAQSGGSRTVTFTNTGRTTFAGSLTVAENNASRTLSFDVDGSSGGVLLTGALLVGGGSGADGFTKRGAGTLSFGAAQSFAGTLTLAGGTLELGDFAHAFTALSVTAASVLDFGAGASVLDLDTLTVQSGVTLTVSNWTQSVDSFFAQFDPGSAVLGRVIFSGHGPGAVWNNPEVRPVPEPAAAGLLLLGGSLAATLGAGRWRRGDR